MKNKLKLVLWGKNLQLPMNYDKLEFDKYELKNRNGYDLYFYKNNEMIKEIWYWENGNKLLEYNYKNRKQNGKQYGWWSDGKLNYEYNFKNGKLDGKQYMWGDNGKLNFEWNFKNGIEINEK